MGSFLSRLFNVSDNRNKKTDPISSKGHYDLGCAYVEMREDENALRHFDIAIQEGVTEAFEARAFCLQGLEYYFDSISDFDNAIKYNPSDCNNYYGRGVSKHTIGDFEGAEKDSSLAIECAKINSDVNMTRILQLKERGNYSETLPDYYRAMTMRWTYDLKKDLQSKAEIRKANEEGNMVLAERLQTFYDEIYNRMYKRAFEKRRLK